MTKNTTTRRKFLEKAGVTGMLLPLGIETALAEQNTIFQSKSLNVICVGAHPDDPESGCGGTLIRYVKSGHQVTVVYLTRGESGIPGKSHQEAAQTRTDEAEKACKIMGTKPVFAGQTDGDTMFDQKSISQMMEILRSLKPDLLFTHWPIDSHPDHQVAGTLSYQCWLRMDRAFPLVYFEVNGGYQTMQFAPTHYVDISQIADQKKKALYAHQSQDPDDIYFNHHAIMQQYRGREIGVKEAEAFVLLDASGQAFPLPTVG